jgi:translocator protein
VVVVYVIGVSGWTNLPTNAEISEKYSTLVTPVRWASFILWVLVFVMQLLWVLQQFYWHLPENHVEAIQTVQGNYVLVVIAQIAWIITFSNEWLEISLCMMLVTLYNLFVIVTSLGPLQPPSPANLRLIRHSHSKFAVTQKVTYFLTELPFALHLGCIIVATIVNANVILVSYSANSNIQYCAALGSLVFLLICAVLFLCFCGETIVPFVIIWAIIAIRAELESPNDTIAATFPAEQINYFHLCLISIFLLLVIIECRIGDKVRRQQTATYASIYLSSLNRDESNYIQANH